jgi:hypothetical protein
MRRLVTFAAVGLVLLTGAVILALIKSGSLHRQPWIFHAHSLESAEARPRDGAQRS